MPSKKAPDLGWLIKRAYDDAGAGRFDLARQRMSKYMLLRHNLPEPTVTIKVKGRPMQWGGDHVLHSTSLTIRCDDPRARSWD
jgi:hypothetical protein